MKTCQILIPLSLFYQGFAALPRSKLAMQGLLHCSSSLTAIPVYLSESVKIKKYYNERNLPKS